LLKNVRLRNEADGMGSSIEREDVMVYPHKTVHKAYLQFAAVHNDGFQLEVCPADDAGDLANPDPLLRILADDQESLWIELHDVTGAVVRMPLAEIERAIAAARPEVHGEVWYDRK
jgi:hypothetical protein